MIGATTGGMRAFTARNFAAGKDGMLKVELLNAREELYIIFENFALYISHLCKTRKILFIKY